MAGCLAYVLVLGVKMKPTIAIIGCGTVGTAMGKLLARVGYPITGVATNLPKSTPSTRRDGT